MPTNYQFQPLPLANEEEFDNFVMELFNELNPNSEYETYGRRGERQDGIDIICYEDNVVIQCKKKELAHRTTSVKQLKTKLKKEFRADLQFAVNCDDFHFDKFIFATTFPTDTELMKLARELSKEFKKDVKYCGWGVITQKLHNSPNTLRKFYDSLVLESTRLSDNTFKENVKNMHIIDQCYESLIRFDGLKFVDPRIIAGIFPFNVSNQRSSPLYSRFCLATNNDALTELFTLISVRKEGNFFYVKRGKKSLVKKRCDGAENKLRYIQTTLDNCLIHCIKTTDDVHHKIPGVKNSNCECSGCLTEELRFSDLILSLKSGPDTLDTVYGYYQLHEFKEAKSRLKNYLNQELNPIGLSLGRYNEYWLSILASNDRVSKYEFYSKIRSVEFDNEPVQEAIIDLEQDRILSKAHQKIDSVVDEIKKIHDGYATGKFTTSGPDYATQLTVETMIVYAHHRNNFLIKDVYNDHKNLFRKALSGWLFSINTSKKYNGRLESLGVFQIAMSVYCNSGKGLFSILKETSTKQLILSQEASVFLKKISLNYFGQYNNNNRVYGEFLKDSYELQSNHRSLFQSLLVNLAYSSIEECPTDLSSSLMCFIENENFLYLYDLKFVGILFEKKGAWFTAIEHIQILKLHLDSEDSKSSELIYRVLYSYNKHYSNSKLKNEELALKIIDNMGTSLSSYPSISYLRQIVEKLILKKIDQRLLNKLEDKFDAYLYRVTLVGKTCLISEDEQLFSKYIEYINDNKGVTVDTDKDGFEVIHGYDFINFVSGILHSKNRNLDDPSIIKGLSNLSPYQEWMLASENFDYSKFKVEWIGLSDDPILLKHLGKSPKLLSIIQEELRTNPNNRLGENYLKMIL